MLARIVGVGLLAGVLLAGGAPVVADDGGGPYAWGFNGVGQLGDGTSTARTSPVAVDKSGVLAGRSVTAVSAGGAHSCAVADGRVFCWGNNGNGQLGDGTTTARASAVAVDTSGVLAGRSVTAVSAGAYHSCAVAGGRVFCWGYNAYGQLGDGTTTDRSSAVAVDASGVLAGRSVTAVSAGAYHSCAVADGRVFCWGSNNSGRLGDATTTQRTSPVAVYASGVLDGRTVNAVSAGDVHSCAVAGGRAFCWGDNTYGRLGDGTNTPRTEPVAVGGVLPGRSVTAVSAGGMHSCAVADGRVFCWGSNNSGRLGDGTVTQRTEPVAVLLGPVRSVAAGGGHTLALRASVPSVPRSVSGLPGDAQVSVSWQPPVSDGGSAVSGYVVTAAPGGASCTTADSSCVVAGLANGTAYTFSVVARNAVGDSPAAVSGPVTPQASPVVLRGQLAKAAPKRIKKHGVTVLTKKNARTTAGLPVATKVTGKGKGTKYKVIRGKKGKVSVRTFGQKGWRLVLVQSAPATEAFSGYRLRTVYVNGKRA